MKSRLLLVESIMPLTDVENPIWLVIFWEEFAFFMMPLKDTSHGGRERSKEKKNIWETEENIES